MVATRYALQGPRGPARLRNVRWLQTQPRCLLPDSRAMSVVPAAVNTTPLTGNGQLPASMRQSVATWERMGAGGRATLANRMQSPPGCSKCSATDCKATNELMCILNDAAAKAHGGMRPHCL
jgi:hypothetical protein